MITQSGDEMTSNRRDVLFARRRDGRGMVTAELAVSILAALAVLTMLCWGIYLILMQMRIIDTAGEVARQAARGDKAGVARAEDDAPRGAVVARRSQQGMVSAEWAVGLIAAIAVAGVLLAVVTNGAVRAALLAIILKIIGTMAG